MNALPLLAKTQRNSKQHQMRAESDAEKGWDNKKTKENNCISSVPSPVSLSVDLVYSRVHAFL